MTGLVEKIGIENLRGKLVLERDFGTPADRNSFCLILFAKYDWDSRDASEPYLIKYLSPQGRVIRMHISGNALDDLQVI